MADDPILDLLDADLARRDTPPLGLRAFAESSDFCDLGPSSPSPLSALIAAIMEAADGIRPTTIDDEACLRHFGCTLDELPNLPRRTVVVRAGGRGGKTSRLLAVKAVQAAWSTPIPRLGKNEKAVSLLIAPDLTLAHQILNFCAGYIDASDTLRAAVVRETRNEITLRRPDGQQCTIRVRAAARGGRGGRGFVLVFCGMDEACFFLNVASGVVNDKEIYRAVIQRIVPHGQCWIVSTPWIAATGLLEEELAENFGTHAHTLCAVAPTRALNPTWDPDGAIEAKLRETDPDNARREIDAEPLEAGSAVFFDRVSIDAAVNEDRALALSPIEGGLYGAGGDFAFRKDSSAQALVRKLLGVALRAGESVPPDRYALAALEEQAPTRTTKLKPSTVVDAFAAVLARYHVGEIACDSHEREEVRTEFGRHHIAVVAAPEGQAGKAESYTFLRLLLRENRIELPKHPRLLLQLRNITARPMPGGGLAVTSPRQLGGGHGDLVSALVVAAVQARGALPPRKSGARIHPGTPGAGW